MIPRKGGSIPSNLGTLSGLRVASGLPKEWNPCYGASIDWPPLGLHYKSTTQRSEEQLSRGGGAESHCRDSFRRLHSKCVFLWFPLWSLFQLSSSGFKASWFRLRLCKKSLLCRGVTLATGEPSRAAGKVLEVCNRRTYLELFGAPLGTV